MGNYLQNHFSDKKLSKMEFSNEQICLYDMCNYSANILNKLHNHSMGYIYNSISERPSYRL